MSGELELSNFCGKERTNGQDHAMKQAYSLPKSANVNKILLKSSMGDWPVKTPKSWRLRNQPGFAIATRQNHGSNHTTGNPELSTLRAFDFVLLEFSIQRRSLNSENLSGL